MYSDPHSFFHILQGNWILHRECLHQQTILFHGHGIASFSPRAHNELLYEENLQTRYHSHHPASHSTKQYIYALEQGELNIYFKSDDDISLFMQLDFTQNKPPIFASSSHLCPPDIYSAKFIYHNIDEFSITYDISGPQKSHLISSKYQREK